MIRLSVANLRQDSNILQKMKETHEPTMKILDKIENITAKYDPGGIETVNKALLNSTQRKQLVMDRYMLEEYEKDIAELQMNSSLVHIYFKELGVVKYSRDELFGLIDVVGT